MSSSQANSNPPIVVVVGPTASGKSGVAIELARRLGGEVVSADSLQVYRYFNVGTGKVSAEECGEIRHHLIDIIEPDESFDAACFQRAADRSIKDIISRGKKVIVAGGTGLYIRALLHGLFDLPSDPRVREELNERREQEGLDVLHRELLEVDPVAGARIAPRDGIRIVRALEVYQISGRTFTDLAAEHGHRERRYPSLIVGLMPERATLYQTIEKRIDMMLRAGWSTELHVLRKRGYPPTLKPMQSIGYRELNQVLDGTMDAADVRQRIGKSTRTYAKRQLTWFRKEDVQWFENPEQLLDDKKLHERIEEFLKSG